MKSFKRMAGGLVLAILATAGRAEDPGSHGDLFGIYLMDNQFDRVHVYARTSLADLPLDDSPWIAAADIAEYRWATHEIVLKPESAELMFRFRDPPQGPDIPFVVVAGGERIYRGSFPCLASSTMPWGVRIARLESDEPGVRLEPPIVEGVTDRRDDERIRSALEAAGVLRD